MDGDTRPPVTIETLKGQDGTLGELMGRLAEADEAGQLPGGWVKRDG